MSGLRDHEFAIVRDLALDYWGLVLSEDKRPLVLNRLRRLGSQLDCPDLVVLVRRLHEERDPADLMFLFDALSTNKTSFFRGADQFELLRNELPAWSSALTPIKIWSAGCSTGCEPYSIAMVLHDTLASKGPVNARILATDLSLSALHKAERAIYPEPLMQDLDRDLTERHFEPVVNRQLSGHRVRSHIRDLVTLGLVNLMEPWKMTGPFDAIFCRNVMIYFNAETRCRLLERFAALLRPGGLLLLGSAENMTTPIPGLERIKSSCLRKAS